MPWLPMGSNGEPNPSSELLGDYFLGTDSELVSELF